MTSDMHFRWHCARITDETLERLDWAYEPPCDMNPDHMPARYRIGRVCGCAGLLCRDCADIARLFPNYRSQFECTQCGHTVWDWVWNLITITPLGSRT